MAVKGEPICHWCRRDMDGKTPYRTTMPGIEYAGVYVMVCGPRCPSRPDGALLVKRDFGSLVRVG